MSKPTETPAPDVLPGEGVVGCRSPASTDVLPGQASLPTYAGLVGRDREEGFAALLPRRFMDKVELSPDGCWLWTGALQSAGYGHLGTGDGRTVLAHRFAYELLVGPITTGLQIDHLCRVRHCVNPAHLEPVTGAENTMRGNSLQALNAKKTHCHRGHPFDEANTYLRRARGSRECRACHAESMARCRAKGSST